MRNTDFIKGIIPAVVTPMTEDQELDERGLEVLLDHLIRAGVDGVFTVGTAGEFWALGFEEKRRVFEWTVAYTRGRVPVYVGTCANTTREAVLLAEAAREAGADGISVLTPVFITPDDAQLFAHYKAIANAVPQMPVLLYGNPDRTNNKLSVNLVVRLANEVENVVGIKDSSGDLTTTAEYVRRAPAGFRVLMGRDTLIFAALLHGACGAIAASANLAPELAVDIYRQFVAGNTAGALAAQQRLAPLRGAFGLGTFPAMLKTGAEMVGLPAGPPRAPVTRLDPADRAKLRDVLITMGKLQG
jgi:4-hydroxy-tetrahydrodipicolinate synthase